VRWLAVLFLLVPILELWLLLRIGAWIGLYGTVAMVVGTAFVGAWLAKREGLRVLSSWRQAMAERRMPEEGITSGVLVLVGAVLLVTPGVLTDVLGILLLVPPTRRRLAGLLETYLAPRFVTRGRAFDVRVVTPESPRGPGRVLDVEGQTIEDSQRRR
jgi:UPF0716 protein FxsA